LRRIENIMSEVVMEVKNLSKSFKMRDNRLDSVKGTIAQLFTRKQDRSKDFCALKNVSFNLHRGEALGVIGKNGAGKSTLLRLLSGISQPDEGEINFYGKAVSILDIGAGFHPELTGRENVYLSASLYKFTKEKIDERFKEIVDFSGIEKFIDEPVKNYSSGMYLRLAFSIITCLDADIYMIDEVINVGDANFQMKCKSRIEDLIATGKTLLIASHNLNEISILCNRIILMEGGVIVDEGGNDVIQKYMTRALPEFFSFEGNDFYHLRDIKGSTDVAGLLKINTCGIEGYKVVEQGIDFRVSFKIFMELELKVAIPVVIRLKVYDSTGVLVFICTSLEGIEKINSEGVYRFEFEMPANIFNARMYSIDFAAFNAETKTLLLNADKFLTLKMSGEKSGKEDYLPDRFPGIIRPLIPTRVLKIE
jgi:ABC-type polysaccharide/polyol phosphate transport system ATPase subunit